MAVSIEKTGAGAIMLTVTVNKSDYQAELDQTLKTMRQRANIPGFRQGKAPMGIILKQYGTGAKVEAINKSVGEQLYNYIQEEKLAILGEPMPVVELGAKIDFAKDEDFSFLFEAAVAPEINVSFDKSDTATYYEIEATEEMLTGHIEQMLNQAGEYTEGDKVEDNDLVSGRLIELEGGEPKEDGLVKESALLLPRYVGDEESRNIFIGADKGATVTFSPFKAYNGNAVELASFLGVDKEAVPAYEGVDFHFEIVGIRRHVPAQLGEEFYKKVFGDDTEIKDEAGLKAEIATGFREQFSAESDFKLLQDLRPLVLAKVGKVEFAEEILKRWLLEQDKELTAEKAAEQLPAMLEDLVYKVVRDNLLKERNLLEVEREELYNFALVVVKNQFAQYGMMSVPDEVLAQQANYILDNADQARNILGRVHDTRVAGVFRDLITINTQVVSPEEFSKLVNPATE